MVKPWQVVLATIGIFLAGLVTGGAITFRAIKTLKERRDQVVNQQNAAKHPLSTEQMGPQLIRRIAMTDDLALAPAQRFRINQISRTAAEKLNRLRRETTLNSLLIIEEMQDEISALLTPAQRAKFEVLLTDQRERMLQYKQDQQNNLHSAESAPAAAAPAKP
jgi:Spy/CpxP family protein refolding chaperone